MGKLLIALLTTGKLSKVLLTAGSMLVSILVYMQFYGPLYATGFVLLIFVHEMGHFLAARQRGLDVGAPTFIPFIGAYIAMKQKPHDVETEAYVALAGPLVGTLGALACYYWGRHTGQPLLVALSYSGFILNLFNLIPLSPLDGGRVTAVLSPRIWLVGAPMLAAMFFYMQSPLLILIGIMALPQLQAAWRYDPKAPENAAYYSISMEQRVFYGLYYLLLVGFLALMSYNLSHELHIH